MHRALPASGPKGVGDEGKKQTVLDDTTTKHAEGTRKHAIAREKGKISQRTPSLPEPVASTIARIFPPVNWAGVMAQWLVTGRGDGAGTPIRYRKPID